MNKYDSYKDLMKAIPNFFCDMEVLNALISKESDRDDYGEVNFTIDVIDSPFMVLYKAEEKNATVKIYKRRDVYTHDESGYCIGNAILDKVSGGVSMDFQNSLDPNRMGIFVVACLKLNEYIQENNLSSMYNGLDADQAGVLITQDEGILACKVVAGKERPDIMCDTVLNGLQMCRPYVDEEKDDSPFGVFRNWVKKEERYGQFVVNNELDKGNVTIRCIVTGTHHGERADRIEYITVGDALTLKRVFDSPLMSDSIEVFNSSDESVGWIEVYMSDILAPLMDDGIVTISNVIVASVIPKSQRGKRARAAEMYIDVEMHIDFDKINNENSDKEDLNAESLAEEGLNEEGVDEKVLNEEGLDEGIVDEKVLNEESLNEEELSEADTTREELQEFGEGEQTATRSEQFGDLENQFKLASKEELVEIATTSARKIIEAFSDGDQGEQISLMLLVFGAKLGLVGDGVINEQERELVNQVFEPLADGDLSSVYDMIGNEIEESDYELVRVLTEMGNEVVMPFLSFILSFAYIDRVLEDEVAKRLDVLFGLHLLVDSMQNEKEEVPVEEMQSVEKIKLVEDVQPEEEVQPVEDMQPEEEVQPVEDVQPEEEGQSAAEIVPVNLDAAIVQWFRSDDQLRPLNDIVAHFPDVSRDAVKQVLDGLCNKGILYGGDSIIRCMYGLVPCDNTKGDESLPASKEESLQSQEGYKVVTEEETITVNDDFSITLQPGMYYATPEHVKLDEMAILNIGRLKEDKQDAEGYIQINVNKDADFFGTFFAKKFEPGQYEQVLERFDFEKYLQEKTLQESNDNEEQINEWATAVRVKMDFYSTYKVYKNEDNLKIGYYSNLIDGVPAYMIQIITRKCLYMCNSVFTAGVLALGLREFLGDSVVNDEKFLDGILNSITLVNTESDVSVMEKTQSESNVAEEAVKKQLDELIKETTSALQELDKMWSENKQDLQKQWSDKIYASESEMQMDADAVKKIIDSYAPLYEKLLDAYDESAELLWGMLKSNTDRLMCAEQSLEIVKKHYEGMDSLRYDFTQPENVDEDRRCVSYTCSSYSVKEKWESRRDEAEKQEELAEKEQQFKNDMLKEGESTERIHENKGHEKQSQYEQIDADIQKQKEEVINAKEQERNLIEEKKNRNRENLRLHHLELESLGAMRLIRKHSLERMIREEELEDEELAREIQANQIRLKDELRALDRQAEEMKKELRNE